MATFSGEKNLLCLFLLLALVGILNKNNVYVRRYHISKLQMSRSPHQPTNPIMPCPWPAMRLCQEHGAEK